MSTPHTHLRRPLRHPPLSTVLSLPCAVLRRPPPFPCAPTRSISAAAHLEPSPPRLTGHTSARPASGPSAQPAIPPPKTPSPATTPGRSTSPAPPRRLARTAPAAPLSTAPSPLSAAARPPPPPLPCASTRSTSAAARSRYRTKRSTTPLCAAAARRPARVVRAAISPSQVSPILLHPYTAPLALEGYRLRPSLVLRCLRAWHRRRPCWRRRVEDVLHPRRRVSLEQHCSAALLPRSTVPSQPSTVARIFIFT